MYLPINKLLCRKNIFNNYVHYKKIGQTSDAQFVPSVQHLWNKICRLKVYKDLELEYLFVFERITPTRGMRITVSQTTHFRTIFLRNSP
jgi:hypothetical protein